MSADYTIIVNKSSFAVYCSTPSKRGILTEFSRRFNTYTYIYDYKKKQKVRKLDRQYVGGNHHALGEFIYNIQYIKDFMWWLNKNGLDRSAVEIIQNEKHKINKLGINFNYDDYTLRDYQKKANRQTRNYKDKFSVLIDHQTGKGKGIMSISSICDINKAVGILILPKYIEKWIIELKETTDATDDDIVVIQGGADLIKYMDLAQRGEFKAKIMIFSNRTISNYIRDYEDCKDLDDFIFPVYPTRFMETFKLGPLMIDEVHQEFYSVFKACLYFNAEIILGMSATLVSDDPNKSKYYKALFPDEVRLSNMDHDRYIELHEVRYKIMNYKRIQCVNNMGYNHILFEQSIMRHSMQLKNYVTMIDHYIKIGYMDRRVEGDKLLIFAASIDMCTQLTYVLKRYYEDLKIARYVEDDPYENVMESDIVISTLLSSGTAFDISGLITVINTVSVKSQQANIQALGRLRKKDGKQMKYYQLYSNDIQKQKDYHKYRIEILKPRVKEIFYEEYATMM